MQTSERTTPCGYCTGNGSEALPFGSADGTAGLASAIQSKLPRGGEIFLPAARYDLTAPVTIGNSCLALRGEVWGYSSDPNGVFEGRSGTKLRLCRGDFPALRIGATGAIGGCQLENIGVQGAISGMDTRGFFDPAAPQSFAGLSFADARTDQCECRRLSFCGLAAGIVATANAEIDACTFDGINADGCCTGIYFAPRASFYTRFRHCVVADNPAYGMYVSGKNVKNLDIRSMTFVRNGGALPAHFPQPAAVSLDGVNGCTFCDCVIDDAGTFWFYAPDATRNEERQKNSTPLVSLAVRGNLNRITGNLISHTKAAAITLSGDGNVLLQNTVDGDVHVCGSGNVISDLIFTKPENKLYLSGPATITTCFSGIPEERIVRVEKT